MTNATENKFKTKVEEEVPDLFTSMPTPPLTPTNSTKAPVPPPPPPVPTTSSASVPPPPPPPPNPVFDNKGGKQSERKRKFEVILLHKDKERHVEANKKYLNVVKGEIIKEAAVLKKIISQATLKQLEGDEIIEKFEGDLSQGVVKFNIKDRISSLANNPKPTEKDKEIEALQKIVDDLEELKNQKDEAKIIETKEDEEKRMKAKINLVEKEYENDRSIPSNIPSHSTRSALEKCLESQINYLKNGGKPGVSSFKPNNSSSSSNSSTNNVSIDISSITNELKKHLENELKKYFESTTNNNYNQESINSIINPIFNELNEIKEKVEKTNLPPSFNDNSEQLTSVAKELERVKNELEMQYKKMSEHKKTNFLTKTKGTGTEIMWGLSVICCLFFLLMTNEFRKIQKIVKRKK